MITSYTGRTWMSWTMALNCDERSIQVLTSSMAVSKFFTYSPYIFRKGASFWRMSPIRGFTSLSKGRKSGVILGSRGELVHSKHSQPVSNLAHLCLQRNTVRILAMRWGGCVWEHRCVHFGREKEMTAGLEEMFFLTKHCGGIQQTVWSLTFSPTLSLFSHSPAYFSYV